jgi:hypothetical protein
MENFEPYAAFQRINRDGNDHVSALELGDFLR